MNFKKFFKQSEADKINQEIFNEVFPMKAYENNRKLGYAQALYSINEVAEKYIEGKYSKHLDAHDLIKILKEIAGSDKVVNEYFYRLKEDK